MMIEDQELAKLFEAESAEHLAKLDDGFLRLEKTPADLPLLEEIFRESHSLKGAARMLGLFKIETAAHGLETILNTARKGESQLTPDVIEHMNEVLVYLRKLVHEVFTDDTDVTTDEATSHLTKPVNEIKPVVAYAESKNSKQCIETLPTPTSGISSADMVGQACSSIRGAGDVLLSDKPASDHVDGYLPTEGDGIQVVRKNNGVVDLPFRIETVRVETRKLDDLLTLVGELSVIEGRMQHRLTQMDALLEQWSLLERNRRKYMKFVRGADSAGSSHETLRNMLLDESDVLARFGGSLKETRDSFFDESSRLETTVSTLEERVHSTRLLPISTVFALFPRMVRDLARQQGKEVELVLEGGEINVDKRILEEMKDPLMHLLRNAIDHGIEMPDEREQQGKHRVGRIRLRALRENSTAQLEISDDGRGLDVEGIRRVALKRGLYDATKLASMSQAQLQQLIFLPGFSTSTFVTELSGRGVGLDVVRVNVERLKGDIRIDSRPHAGTAIQIHLPLSLATTRLLLAGVDNRSYGVPIEFVQATLRVHEKDIFPLEGYPAIEFEGQSIITPRLADLLELPDSSLHSNQEDVARGAVCIVIQVGDERMGLRVDELLDEEEVVVKSLVAPLIRVRNVSGLSILGSGEICPVLNPADLVRSAHKKNAAYGVRNSELKPESRSQPLILLVEDSSLVRAMEKRILEEAGYEVVTAVDGVDGLDALGKHTFVAVVSDIMMPNMDGLTLTAHIRKEPRYKDLPVILVTTLSSDEDKRRGLEVGANAYIPKPSFDQRVLLDTLKRLI